MKKGILKTGLLYLLGLGLAGISYSISGDQAVHGPGLHHLIILLTFILGIGGLIVTTILYFTEPRTEYLKGMLFTFLFMTLTFVSFMLYFIIQARSSSELEVIEDKITVESSGDTITMYNDGSPVYMQVKDSVFFNFIDSTKANWSEQKEVIPHN
jgi:hypothetical protein